MVCMQGYLVQKYTVSSIHVIQLETSCGRNKDHANIMPGDDLPVLRTKTSTSSTLAVHEISAWYEPYHT